MPPTPSGRRRWVAAAVVLPVLVVTIDALTWRGLFDEGPPRLDAVALLRSTILAIAVVALLWGLARRERGGTWPRWGRATVAISTVAHTIVALLASLDAGLIHRLGQEDGVVENLTAVAFVLGGGLVLSTTRRWNGLRRLVVLGYGLVMVLAGLEEISYGQRLLGFSGPDIVTRNNLQNEFTLHNLATDPTETAFYAAMALVLVLLPVLRSGPWDPLVSWLAPLAPVTWTVVAAAPVFALTHGMWDVVPVQLTFWTSVGVLALLAATHRGRERSLTILAFIATVVIQVICVAFVELVELHDLTEFKELLLGALVVLQAGAMRSSARAGALVAPDSDGAG